MSNIDSYTGVLYAKMLTNNGAIASMIRTIRYLGFKSCSENPRIRGIVMINIFNTRMFSVCHHSLINYIVKLIVHQVLNKFVSLRLMRALYNQIGIAI